MASANNGDRRSDRGRGDGGLADPELWRDAMSSFAYAALDPGSVVMLKIVTVALVAMYLTVTVPGGWHLVAVLLAFACLCALTLIDDDTSRAVLRLPSLRSGS
jgi:hypothetical protein